MLGVVIAATAAAVSLTPASADPGAQPVNLVHLRLSIATTSDWTQIQVRPGKIVSQYVSAVTGNGVPGGLGFGGSTGVSTQIADVVFAGTSPSGNYQIEIDKGYVGVTWLQVANLNGGQSAPFTTMLDTVHSVTDGANRLIQNVPATTLMGTVPLAQPHADARHLVLAFYYPWWFGGYADSTLADQPANPRSVWDHDGVESMTAQAKANGVDGFIVSWAGAAADGSAFDTALAAAQDQQQVITGYLETQRMTASPGGPADPTLVQTSLSELLQRAAGNSAFLTAADGVPVVFVYSMAWLTPSQWGTILANLHASGQDVHLVGDVTDPTYLPVEWGVHQYSVNRPAAALTNWSQQTALAARTPAIANPSVAPKLVAATVSPGFDDHALRGTKNPVAPRAGGSTYAATWSAALAGQPDWVLITSWNEWYEGTSIEPGVNAGSDALAQTAQFAAAWHGQS